MSLAADPNNGQVWVGTFGGLNVYQPATGRFHTYTHDDRDPASLPSNYVSGLYVDRQGTLWMDARSNILYRMDVDRNRFIQYKPKPVKAGDAEQIHAIEQDGLNDSLIWVGTDRRLFSFNKYRKTFDYNHPPFLDIEQIYAHANGYLYIRDKSGLITVYRPDTGERVHKITPQAKWIFGKIIRKSADELWINCNNGIAVLDTKDHLVSYPWRNDPAQKKKYEIDLVDRQGRMWSASTAGLKVYDPASTQFSNYIYETTGATSPYITQRLVEDTRQEAVFLNASAGNGVHRFDLRTRDWLHIPRPKDYPDDLFYGTDLAMLESGQLLILAEEGIFTLSADGRSMVPHP
ncbi:MAG: hypothetical protein KDC61_18485, partial [Saprospiraceae bacterium]|nr:hypothetical protein [Saprospiraceae bacterium]